MNEKYPDIAQVFFVDGTQMGPSIVLLNVGNELAELLVWALRHADAQEFAPTTGNVTTAFIFRAYSTGNMVTCNAPPISNSFPSQLHALTGVRENAVGGIGTVIVDIIAQTVSTYGGIGFPDVAPSNPFQVCVFPLQRLNDVPLSAPPEEEVVDEPVKPKRARRKKKTAKTRKPFTRRPPKKKAAAGNGTSKDLEI